MKTRAGHRTETSKIEKDLTDATNYYFMLGSHIENARDSLL